MTVQATETSSVSARGGAARGQRYSPRR